MVLRNYELHARNDDDDDDCRKLICFKNATCASRNFVDLATAGNAAVMWKVGWPQKIKPINDVTGRCRTVQLQQDPLPGGWEMCYTGDVTCCEVNQ